MKTAILNVEALFCWIARKLRLLALAVFISAVPALAQVPETEPRTDLGASVEALYSREAHGVGASSCLVFLEHNREGDSYDKKSDRENDRHFYRSLIYVSWLAGYFSGRNHGKDQFPTLIPNEYFGIVKQYCEDYPMEQFWKAAMHVYEELSDAPRPR